MTALAAGLALRRSAASAATDPCALAPPSAVPAYRFALCAEQRSSSTRRVDSPRRARTALRELERLHAERGTPDDTWRLAVGLALAGEPTRAVRLLERIEPAAAERAAVAHDLAIALALRAHEPGRADDRFAALDRLASAAGDRLAKCNLALLRAELGLGPGSAAADCVAWREVPRERTVLALLPASEEVTRAETLIADPDRLRDFVARAPERWRTWLVDHELARLARPSTTLAERERAEAIAGALASATADSDALHAVAEVVAAASPALATHLEAFGRGQAALRDYEVETALAELDAAAAGLRNDAPTVADWAEAGVATCHYYLRDHASAERRLLALEARARAAGRPLLLARALWLRANIAQELGFGELAVDFAAESVDGFAAAGERRHEAAVRSILAGALHHLGELDSAAEQWQRALAEAIASDYAARVPVILGSIARSQARRGRVAAALELQREAHAADVVLGNPLGVAESSLALARLHVRAGDPAPAAALFAQARETASRIPSSVQRAKTTSLIDLAAAESDCRNGSDGALAAFDNALALWRRQEFRYLLPEVLLARAACHATRADTVRAVADFDAALDELAAQEASIVAARSRALWFDQSREALDALLTLLLDAGDGTAAIERLERLRADRTPTLAAVRSQPSPPSFETRPVADGCALVFLALPDRLARAASCGGDWSWRTLPVTRSRLERAVSDALAEMSAATRFAPSAELRDLAGWLFEDLPPTASGRRRLVIVPDGPLDRAPFAALQRSLAPNSPIASVPSEVDPTLALATSPELAAARASPEGRLTALVLAAPALDPVLVAAYPALPGAEREGRRLVELIPGSELLAGPTATRAAFLDGAPRHAVLHLAAHFVVDHEEPLRSRMLTADGPGGAEVATGDVLDLRLHRARLAYLAGCETGRGFESRILGTLAMSRGFLVAGVPQVVATLWPIADGPAARFGELFYTELLSGRPVEDALRAAQSAAMSSPDLDLAAPRTWAAFQLLGGGGAAERP